MNIDARSPAGNAFYVMATVRRFLKRVGRAEDWPAIRERMTSGDYNNLCDVAEKVTDGIIKITNRGMK